MPDFPIVDAHVHLYDPAAISYGWMKNAGHLNSRHASEEYSAAIGATQVDKLVFLEVDADAGHEVAEAEWVADAATRDPRIQAMVANLPLEKGPAAVEADMEKLSKMPLTRGIRRLIQGHVDEPGWCLRPDFVAAVQLLPRYGLSFDICIYHPQMADAIELVRRCPDVSFILDHIGKPGIKAGVRERWWGQMNELATYGNVICKVSGAITEASHTSWTYDQVAPYVSHAIEAFGFDRVAFGGDWPVLENAAKHPDWVALVDRVTAGASEADLRKLYRDTAIAFYRM